MTVRNLLSRLIRPLTLLALAAGILSCAPVEAGPRAWIDWPRDGYETPMGETITIISHAYAPEGVAEVQFAVNGEPYRLGQPAQPGEEFVEIEMEWEATEPGDYLLSVTPFSMTGEAGNPAHVTVTVVGEVPELLLTPTEIGTEVPPTAVPSPPTGTPRPPTATSPPATGTPRPPTATPRGPTATPPPPTIVSFQANPPSIEAGDCATLSWAVEGVIISVWLDGTGVGDHDSTPACPTATTTYTLRAVGPGGEATATVRVSVEEAPTPTFTHTASPTPDNQGPPAPSIVSPSGGVEVPCDDVVLDWNPVSDPSGIGTYYVKWEREVTPGNWQSLGGQATTATQVTISLGCGISYRWSVRAEDGAGNPGPWADWASFGVTFG